MKKRIAVLTVLALLISFSFPSAALADAEPVALSTVSGSSLTGGAAYTISTEAELAKLAELVNGGENCAGNSFILTASITLTDDHNGAAAGKWVPIGSGMFSTTPGTDTTGHPFNGSFYGENYFVFDMDCQVTSCAGLFGYIGESGLVNNLRVSGALKGANCSGGIAAINQGRIINCQSDVFYTNYTTTSYDFIGGIVGANQGSVQNCRNYGLITGYRGASGGDAHIGGVVGFCKDNAEVINCFNTANVSGWSNIGGVVGDTHSEYCTYIVNCYNLGPLSGEDVCGGIVGVLNNKSRLYNSYNSGGITTHTSTYSGALAGMIGFNCVAQECYYLDSSFSQPYGDTDTTTFGIITYNDSYVLASPTPAWGATTLVEALNDYVEHEPSILMRGWMIDDSMPYHTGTVLMSDPEDAAAALGLNAAFQALAVGDNINYQWQVSTDGGTIWSDLASGYGYNSPLYITPDVTAEMNGNLYRCLIDGILPTASATLSIASTPVITTQPVDAYANLGDPIHVSIAATGSPGPFYSWDYSFDGVDWYAIYDEDSEVVVDAMAAMLDGIYLRCVVYNSIGRVTSNAVQLHVATAPSITAQPSDKTAAAGKTATFSAAATGGPAPTYQWQVNRGSGWSDIAGADEASYTTAKVELLNDGYEYRVVVTNMAGSAASNAAKLHVIENADIPTTGDTARPGLWIAVGLLSLGGLCALVLSVRKRRA